MRKSSRHNAPTPDFIEENWEKWGRNWEDRHAGGGVFTWHGRRENIVEALYPMTDAHCAFCDIDNCVLGNNASIEHFQPKAEFHRIAYFWNNLFLCCGECQKKGSAYSELLLKPDEAYYEFDEYFVIEPFTGRVLANEQKPEQNICRANYTIEKYRFNYGERPRLRLKVLNKFRKYVGEEVVEDELVNWSYRFFIEKFLE